ncbi:MAG TPA: hypothetical protein VKA84_25860 [Gemmatimonadaceae bacterium]|nr:hypothetical protein [Gemmatimonadaceae bacterium]
MSAIVLTYLVYIVLSVAITVWVGRTLYTNGVIFLVDVFNGNEMLAHSVNHLLVVGFYLVNLGWVSLALRIGYLVDGPQTAIEALSSKIGFVLLMLGGMHFFNLYVFSRIRRRSSLPLGLPPVPPDACTITQQTAAAAAA